MIEKKKRSKRLSQIMQNNKHFDQAIELYLDQLRKKRDWANLKKKLIECQEFGWLEKKLEKVHEWERRASDLHGKSLDRALETINHMASEISDEQFEELRTWIVKSSHSKEAWNKNMVSIDDSLPLIKAKIIHLAFMSRSDSPINIGEIIKNKD